MILQTDCLNPIALKMSGKINKKKLLSIEPYQRGKFLSMIKCYNTKLVLTTKLVARVLFSAGVVCP